MSNWPFLTTEEEFRKFEMRHKYTQLLDSKPNMDKIITPHKEYWLPALKTLSVVNGHYMSPQRFTHWHDNQLTAMCTADYILSYSFMTARGNFPRPHPDVEAPVEDCTCGIYASINLGEIRAYRHYAIPNAVVIVEPYPDAKVIVGDKGWRAGKVFISEVLIGDNPTVDMDFAAALLSRAWSFEFIPSEMEQVLRF